MRTPGLFRYEHLTENWISGPYGRQRIPDQPLHLDQLSPRLRGLLKSLVFSNVSFVESVYIQPLEHTNCESWEAGWLDLAGNIKPIPGMEDEYSEHYERFQQVVGKEKVQPPDGVSE
jgi:hypothetical protein